VPTLTAVTKPVLSTVAAAGLLLVHRRFWLVAVADANVAVSCKVPPIVTVAVVLSNDTPVAGTITSTCLKSFQTAAPEYTVTKADATYKSTLFYATPPNTVAFMLCGIGFILYTAVKPVHHAKA
jgi:hypothetical protein